jgi:CubicO group peptidase (beta-lactamase class C family)
MRRSTLFARICFLSIATLLVPYAGLAQSTASYRYSAPANLNDGIRVGTLKSAKLDEAKIVSGTNEILKGTYPNIRSLLIFRQNRLVYENYFNITGTDPSTREFLQDLRSVTKTVVGTAVVIAHAQGKIKDLDQPVFDLFPEYSGHAVDGKKGITIRNLLSMTAGLEWDEEISYLNPANSEYRMNHSPNATEFVLSRKLTTKPGSKFVYSGGCSHLLAEIIKRTTGRPIDEFVAKNIFAPLGITKLEWARGSDGLPYGFSGLRLRSRDLAKIGLLLMNRGKWNGKQIIPKAIVSDALSEHILVAPENADGDIVGYGFQIWRFSFMENGSREQLIQMSGNGGQMVFINDKDKTLAVITAGNFDHTVNKSTFDLYMDAIFSAVLDRKRAAHNKAAVGK